MCAPRRTPLRLGVRRAGRPVPASTATSSRRSPVTRRLPPYTGSPDCSGVILARRVARKSLMSSLALAPSTVRPDPQRGRPCRYPRPRGLPGRPRPCLSGGRRSRRPGHRSARRPRADRHHPGGLRPRDSRTLTYRPSDTTVRWPGESAQKCVKRPIANRDLAGREY